METDYAKQQAEAQLTSIHEMVTRLQVAQDAKESERYEVEESIREEIEQDALSIEVRTGWHTPFGSDVPEVEQYRILLCTGGPAVRIMGNLDQYLQPDSAQLEYQDWGTPWTRLPLTLEDIDALLVYARCFYFGE